MKSAPSLRSSSACPTVPETVGRNTRSPGLDMRGVPSKVVPVSPTRTPSNVMIERSWKFGNGLPSAVRRLAA